MRVPLSGLMPRLIFRRLFHPFDVLDEYLHTKGCQDFHRRLNLPFFLSVKQICVPNSSAALSKLQEAEIMR